MIKATSMYFWSTKRLIKSTWMPLKYQTASQAECVGSNFWILWNFPCFECFSTLHCCKKKRDFLIIRSKVGGFLILTVDDNEYFVGWKENLLHKYHQKWLPIIRESTLMFHHIDPIIRCKIGGFLILSVANCEYFVC